jgi:hypothetical protein
MKSGFGVLGKIPQNTRSGIDHICLAHHKRNLYQRPKNELHLKPKYLPENSLAYRRE